MPLRTIRAKVAVVRQVSPCSFCVFVLYTSPLYPPQVGDPAVGKTALAQVWHSQGQKFPKHYQMTCGVDFCVKGVPIPDTDVTVELHLFDTAGQDM